MGLETTAQPAGLSSFRGLNTKLSQISVASREATAIKNIRLTQETIEPRKGNEIFTATQILEGGEPKAVNGIFQANLGGTIYQVVTAGTKIYSMSSGGVLTDITGGLTLTDSKDNIVSFAVSIAGGVDVIVGANGVDAPWKWTGTGNATALGGVGALGNFKYLLAHKERLWGSVGDFVYHSDLRDAESWDALNWVFRITDAGITTNDITGLASFGDNILFCKEKSFHPLSGESAITANYLADILTGDGFISGYSIQEVPSRRYGRILMGMNSRGEIIGYNGTKDLIKASDLIDNKIKTEFNLSRAPYTTAVLVDDEDNYLVNHSSNSSTEHDRFLTYNYFLDGFSQENESTWNIDQGFKSNYVASVKLSNQDSVLFGTYDGWVLKQNFGNRDVCEAYQIANVAAVWGEEIWGEFIWGGLGIQRVSNVVALEVLQNTHNIEVGDTIIVSGTNLVTGVTSFDGTFVVTGVTPDQITYTQVAEDGTASDGIIRIECVVDCLWQGKKNAFINAGYQKQINDFALATSNDKVGQIKTTVKTDSIDANSTNTIQSSGPVYGEEIWGEFVWGNTGTAYTGIKFTTGPQQFTGRNLKGLFGRYFQFKFENVDGYQFSIEEFIMGLTTLGYQSDYRSSM